MPALVSTLSHLHCVRADVLPRRRGAISVRAAGRGGGLRHAGVVLAVADRGADDGEVSAARARARPREQAPPAAILSCGSRRASNTVSRSCATGTTDVLRLCLENRRCCFCSSIVAVLRCLAGAALSVAGAGLLSRRSDGGQFKLHVRAQTGTRIEETARLCDQIEAGDPPGDSGRASWAPSSTTSACPTRASISPTATRRPVGTGDADILVSLAEKHRPTAEYMRALRDKLTQRISRH